MILYHLTNQHVIRHVRQNGLTKGAIPWNLDKEGNPTMRPGFQWLTKNSSFAQQWCLLGNLPYARNAYRITVNVPAKYERLLFSWMELCRRCQPDSAEEINRCAGDVENWYVFFGSIPPSWFLEVARNTGEHLSGEAATVVG